MNAIHPRARTKPPTPLVGIRAIERMLLRHTITHTPEVRLVVAVICNAMVDCVAGGPLERADAEKFLRDWRLNVWAGVVGLHPDFVREVAIKAHYLKPLPGECAFQPQLSIAIADNVAQDHDNGLQDA